MRTAKTQASAAMGRERKWTASPLVANSTAAVARSGCRSAAQWKQQTRLQGALHTQYTDTGCNVVHDFLLPCQADIHIWGVCSTGLRKMSGTVRPCSSGLTSLSRLAHLCNPTQQHVPVQCQLQVRVHGMFLDRRRNVVPHRCRSVSLAWMACGLVCICALLLPPVQQRRIATPGCPECAGKRTLGGMACILPDVTYRILVPQRKTGAPIPRPLAMSARVGRETLGQHPFHWLLRTLLWCA